MLSTSQPANGNKRMEAAWRALADEQDWLDGDVACQVKATADNVLTARRNLIRRAGNVRSLGTTLSANQFRLRAT